MPVAPAATPSVTPASTTSASSQARSAREHIVRAGDTLSGIAAQHGVELAKVIEANPQVRDPDMIHPGQAIRLPATTTNAGVSSATSGGRTTEAGTGSSAATSGAPAREPAPAGVQRDARMRATAATPAEAALQGNTTTPAPEMNLVADGKAELRVGQEGPSVAALQQRLTAAGYPVAATARFGATTQNAVRALQRDQGVQTTGSVGRMTLAALDTAELKAVRDGRHALRTTSVDGGAVAHVQKLLGVETTGVFGATTRATVERFQRTRGLDADGVVGPRTLAALEGAQAGASPTTSAGGAAGAAPSRAGAAGAQAAAPRIDQNALPHERGWAFCGVASALMVRKQQGQHPPINRATLNDAAGAMYLPGSGTSGAAMAQYLTNHGLPSRYTTTGRVSDLVAGLQQGRAVPVGVDTFGGTVVGMDARSARYPSLRNGDSYSHRYGASGHWVTVTGFRGDPSNPTSFTVNDPDSGATVEVSRREFERHSAAGNGLWLVGPR
jgi:peptidoglycan hydrolase-like protein with peptidoglycan-binding domain